MVLQTKITDFFVINKYIAPANKYIAPAVQPFPIRPIINKFTYQLLITHFFGKPVPPTVKYRDCKESDSSSDVE